MADQMEQQNRPAPSLEELRSLDPRTHNSAWNAAYPLLWSAGIRLMGRLLEGKQWRDQREDIVAVAINSVVKGLMEEKLESFNQVATLGDLTSMTLTIVRRRTEDFHRKSYRSLEELVEDLPDRGAEEEKPRLSRAELEEQIAALDPPKPALFRDRFFSDLSTREIAAKRRIPHGTVCFHFTEGLRLLRDWLKD